MPLWKRLLLNLYCHGTLPMRWWCARRMAAEGNMPVIALFWHRIADDDATPWTTTTKVFAQQIAWLKDHFPFVTLDEAQRRIRQGSNREPCVSVTFDDGYSENCRFAIPLLVKERIPFTYFVTVRNVLEQLPFAHDRMRGLLFPPNTVEQLRFMAASGGEIGSHAFTHADFGKIADPVQIQREVAGAKADLEKILGRPVRYFAFPFGLPCNLSRKAFEAVETAGFAGACSAYGGFNYPGDDAFHLQRISADCSMLRMINWLTFDPRKLHVSRFSRGSSDGEDADSTRPDAAVPKTESPLIQREKEPTARGNPQ
jgi:peptidoglycan/xylan/chitin deacetylase (PgdA/CDA1 family)